MDYGIRLTEDAYEWGTEVRYETSGDLAEALRIASEWVSSEGFAYGRRTARVERWPEDGGSDCHPEVIATMDVEVPE